jgi:hypothetical protein
VMKFVLINGNRRTAFRCKSTGNRSGSQQGNRPVPG